MKQNKIFNVLVLGLTLVLSGCGDEGGNDTTPGTPTTPTTSENPTTSGTLSITNPIEDITVENGDALDFTFPSNLCTDSTGAEISYQVRTIGGNVGFIFTNSTRISGMPDTSGVTNISIECYTDTNSLRDSFTITTEDFDKDMIVTATAPSFAQKNDWVYLEANAKYFSSYNNLSYLWEETSGLGFELKSDDSSRVLLIVPEVLTSNTIATFKVTVTDDDGEVINTITDSVDIELITDNAPEVSISFPLTIGEYNADSVDVFGNVEANDGDAVASVIATVNGTEHTAVISGDTWRVENVTLTDTTEIKVAATSTAGLVNYDEIKLLNDTLFKTTIDKNITDIVVLDRNDRMYLQVSANVGDFNSDNKISRFDFDGDLSNYLGKTQSTDFDFSGLVPTSIIETNSFTSLLISYSEGISKVNLLSKSETVLSAEGTGTGTVPGFISDLAYNHDSGTLYAADTINGTISTIDQSSGDRVEILDSLTQLLSLTVNSTTGDLYFSLGINSSGEAVIQKYDGSSTTTIYYTKAGNEGGPISDIAINEAGNELFFVDGSGSLLKLDLATNSLSTIVANLFEVESVNDAFTPLIGLHYHSIRNVVIAAGRDADGTNKLLVIDPVSGDYSKLATGSAD